MVSIWEEESFYAPQDVVIAGSGFTGLWAAFHLKRKHPSLKIAIAERGPITSGASSRNAGFACFGSLSEVVYDARTMGTEKMLELVEMRFRGLERIRKYIDPALIDYENCGGYELYDQPSPGEELAEQMNYINSLLRPITGSKHTYRNADAEIGELGFGKTFHLVKNADEGYLHSGKLLLALLQLVQGMGVLVFNNVNITKFHEEENALVLETDGPFPRRTGQLLVCTNAFAKSLLPSLDIVPARGQVLLTSPIPGLPIKGTFHSDEGYYYFRNLGDRLLLGGARNRAFDEERTESMETSDTIQHALETYLDEVVLPSYRGKYTIEKRWAGIMAMGSEKMPIVQEISPRVFCCVRMSGMGVALAPVVARKVAKMMR
jgi:gamma-glutamylputrescine oxidase